jgi:hypothetical protein
MAAQNRAAWRWKRKGCAQKSPIAKDGFGIGVARQVRVKVEGEQMSLLAGQLIDSLVDPAT